MIIRHELSDETQMLVITKDIKGDLKALDSYPQGPKSKSAFFLKKEPMMFSRDDVTFKDNVLYGDLSQYPLENLVAFIEEVISIFRICKTISSGVY